MKRSPVRRHEGHDFVAEDLREGCERFPLLAKRGANPVVVLPVLLGSSVSVPNKLKTDHLGRENAFPGVYRVWPKLEFSEHLSTWVSLFVVALPASVSWLCSLP